MKYYYFVYLIFYLISLRAFSNERYVCNQADKISPLITNFYIINDKIIMSGVLGNGEYKILNKNINGILAINSSFIGEELGLETILLDKSENIFIYKTFIENKKKENIIEIKGICEFFD